MDSIGDDGNSDAEPTTSAPSILLLGPPIRNLSSGVRCFCRSPSVNDAKVPSMEILAVIPEMILVVWIPDSTDMSPTDWRLLIVNSNADKSMLYGI